MSHIHHLGGYSSAAGQYQEYLGSLRAARLSRRSQLTEAAEEPLTFDSPIDPDQEPEQQARDESGDDPGEPQEGSEGSEGSAGLNEHA